MCLKCKIDTKGNFFESYDNYFINIDNTEIKITQKKYLIQSQYKIYEFIIKPSNYKELIFRLIWNKTENTYLLHNITSKDYETDIIINPYNQDIILGEDIINYLFINKPTFKVLKESL